MMAGRDGHSSNERGHGVSRRRFLQGAAGSGAALVLSRMGNPETVLAAPPFNPNANPITRENRLTPASSWTEDFQLGPAKWQTAITGFPTQTSVNRGQPLQVKLNVYVYANTTATLRVYRLGYYGGKGGRLVATHTNVPVTNQGPPEDLDALGYRTARNWPATVTIPTVGFETGMYLIKIVAAGTYPGGRNENHIPFIVRADGRNRDLLVVMPTNTWQAYNPWDMKSLYVHNSSSDDTVIGPATSGPNVGQQRAAKVSFDRPMSNVYADHNWVLRTEFPLIWWLERQGYNLAYTDDYNVHSRPLELRPPRTKTVVIAGHAEYWSSQMRDNMENARDAGANIASFSANAGYWQVRYEDNGRSLVCFKTVQSRDINTADGGSDGVNDFGPENTARGATDDPLGSDGAVGGAGDNPADATTTFRDAGAGIGDSDAPDGAAPRPFEGRGRLGPNRPENALFGVMYIGDDDHVSYPLQVPTGSGTGGEFGAHPAWRHTTVAGNGRPQGIGNDLVGWEWDAIPKAASDFYGAFADVQPNGVKRLAQTVPQAVAESGLAYLTDAGQTYSATPSDQGSEIHAVTYRAPSGAHVFAAGTMQWSFGLGPHFEAYATPSETRTYEDPRLDSYTICNGVIQQATHNILYDGGVVPATAQGVIFDDQPAPPQGPPQTGPPKVTPRDTKGPKLKLRGGRKRLLRGGRVKVRVTSSSSETDRATGTVTLFAVIKTGSGASARRKRVRIGSRRFTLRPGRSRMVSIKLTRRGRRMLRKRGRLSLMAQLEARDLAMNVTVKRAKIRLRRGTSG